MIFHVELFGLKGLRQCGSKLREISCYRCLGGGSTISGRKLLTYINIEHANTNGLIASHMSSEAISSTCFIILESIEALQEQKLAHDACPPICFATGREIMGGMSEWRKPSVKTEEQDMGC